MAIDGSVSGNGSGYAVDGGIASVGSAGGGLGFADQSAYDAPKPVDYWSHARCKRAYTDFLGSKRNEIVEQQNARRYRHGSHWTAEQINKFNLRQQPIVTFNRIGRKIDGIVGLVEKMRADPKAFPNNPKHTASADLATAALRAALDHTRWKQVTPLCAEVGAIDGSAGVELTLERGPRGMEVGLEQVDPEGFFYDPRSKKLDFSDARYLGCGKWLDADVAKDLMPGHEAAIDEAIGSGADLTTNADGDALWFMPSGELKSIRLVYICYRHAGGWCWALFTGTSKLMEGQSYFFDKHGKPICSYIMFSSACDHDYDRYGFVRNLRSAQDEINARRSKGLHELHTRRIIAEKGAFDDVEKTRREAIRPDGIIERNKGYEAEFDDAKKAQDIAGQVKFLEDAKAEIENFGPNPALLGDAGVSNRSGRAIALMQQAGVAELGPFVVQFKNWKLRVYEGMFNAIKKYWTNERWIRVSDDTGTLQLLPINQMQLDPMTGQPIIVNALGELDVDIILDEGPDVATQAQDMYETLSQVIPAIAPMLTPPQVQAVIQMLVETSPMSAQHKARFMQASAQAAQPDPMAQQAQQIALAQGQADVQETQSKTMLNVAKAQTEGMPQGAQKPPTFELPPMVQIGQALAGIEKSQADAAHKRTLAGAENAYANMAPIDLAERAFQAAADRDVKRAQQRFDQAYDIAELGVRKYEADAARQAKAQRPAGGK